MRPMARLRVLSLGTVLLHRFDSRTADSDAEHPSHAWAWSWIAKILDLFFFLGT
jgi:hypothetical protein